MTKKTAVVTHKTAKPSYVYYLFTCDLSNELVEIGRSMWPDSRRRFKECKHGMRLHMLTSDPIKDFAKAQAYERAEIKALRPRFNKIAGSSPGSLGIPINRGIKKSKITCERISAAKKGVPGHPQLIDARNKISKAFKGIPLSEAHRKKIGDAQTGILNHMYGKSRSAESCRKTSESCKLRRQDKEFRRRATNARNLACSKPSYKRNHNAGMKRAWKVGKFAERKR